MKDPPDSRGIESPSSDPSPSTFLIRLKSDLPAALASGIPIVALFLLFSMRRHHGHPHIPTLADLFRITGFLVAAGILTSALPPSRSRAPGTTLAGTLSAATLIILWTYKTPIYTEISHGTLSPITIATGNIQHVLFIASPALLAHSIGLLTCWIQRAHSPGAWISFLLAWGCVSGFSSLLLSSLWGLPSFRWAEQSLRTGMLLLTFAIPMVMLAPSWRAEAK